MSDSLDQDEKAYDDAHILDNDLMLGWYPGRVVGMARKGGSFLELGLGHGFSAAFFDKAFQRYLVVEGSREIIARFRKKFNIPGLQIIQGFFEDFETSEQFDSIGMGFILEHVSDPALILQRYARFLAADGAIFIAVPNAESLHRRFGHAAGMLPDMTSLSKSDLAFGHRRYFTVNSLTSLVESCGMFVQKIEGLLLKPVTTQQMVDLKLDERILQGMLKVGTDYPELCNAILMKVAQKS